MLAERNTAVVKAEKHFHKSFSFSVSQIAGNYSINPIKNSVPSYSARTDGVSKVSWPVWTEHIHISFKTRANLTKGT